MTEIEMPRIDHNIPETNYVLHRRFDRFGRLVGDAVMERLFKTHVCVVGLGGVGSWAVESLARSGVGKLTLVDFDEICITNTNRQLHAMQGMVGKKKAEVLAERMRKINPQAQVEAKVMFYNEETSEEILGTKPDYVLDGIDNLTAKSHLIATCRERKIPLISSTGAAAKVNPMAVKLKDLAESHTDPMAHQLRKILRQRKGFPSEGPFGVDCVFSDEVPREPVILKYDNGEGFKCVCPQGQNDLHSCDKRNVIYGNASFVTGTYGFVMASWVVQKVEAAVKAEGL